MNHQSELIATNIEEYLEQHEQKELLRLLTCGSVDDGKSTLIGRLLHDSKLIYEDQLAAVKSDSARRGTVADGLDLALLVDGLQDEQEQGITIDVAYRYFSTTKRKFIIADTPGHEQYTRNMATGASNCDLAIILVDARHGVVTQTKRHSFITSLLGIRHIIVAINKMDLVDFSEVVYQQIKSDYAAFSVMLDMSPDLRFLPMSALQGDNVVDPSERMPWYDGAPLMSMLENIQIASDRNIRDFRFPVQYVNRTRHDFRGYSGTVASGLIETGDQVMVLPSRKLSNVRSIVTYDGELSQAYPPQAITITLEDEIDISRGDMLVHPNNLPYFSDRIDAQVVWMAEAPLQPNKQYLFKQACRKSTGVVSNIRFSIDVNSLERAEAEVLQLNEIGRCEIRLSRRIAFDSYKANRATGAFIIIDRLTNVTVGAGMIVGTVNVKTEVTWEASPLHADLKYSSSLISTAERFTQTGQTPKILLLTGLTGSGKSTLAYALERKLFDMGRVAIVLDGQNMRLGPSKDLGFDKDARAENLRRSIEIAQMMNEAGLIAICAFVAPDAEVRRKARERVGESFILAYLNCPLEVCKARDQDGFYAAAEEGIDTVPGVNLPYEEPTDADLVLPTASMSVEECVTALVRLLVTSGAFDAPG